MTLNSSNLFSDSFTQLKAFINTNITDPRSRFKKQWVHPNLPNITDQAFDGYPFITVDVNVDEENKSLDRSTSNKVFRITLGVYSDQSTEVDAIADAIFANFQSETITNSLSDFKSIIIDNTSFDFDIIAGRKISRRLIKFLGRKRI